MSNPRTFGPIRVLILIVASCPWPLVLPVPLLGDEVPPREAGSVGALDESLMTRERERIDVVRRISEPTIAIFDRTGQGGGSGVIISADGFALTNYHVVQPCGEFMKVGLADGTLIDAVIVGIDPVGDVALIKLHGRESYPVATLGDSDRVRQGDWCFTAGNPFLLATDFQPSISHGLISGVQRYQYPAGTLLEYADSLQTDAAVNPGNSGGPLFDERGELIGINGRCSFEKRGRVNVGVGYAISINQIKKFLGSLQSGLIVDHATLGATVSSDESGRVVVTNLLEASDAYRRGLRLDDEIVSFGGRPIQTVNGFKNVLGTYPRGWRIPLVYRRDGELHTVQVRLAGVHSREQLIQLMEGPKAKVAPPEQKDLKQPERAPAPKSPVSDAIEVPEALRQQYEARRGFANFHFNRQPLSRIFDQWSERLDARGRQGEWKIVGRTQRGDACEIVLRDDEAFWISDTAQYRIDLKKDWEGQLAPDGSGGALLALSLWRRLALKGPAEFGEVYLAGRGPYQSDEDYFIVAATYQVAEMELFFDPVEHQLQVIETSTSGDRDPSVLRFGDYRTIDGHAFPGQIGLFWGAQPFDAIQIEEVDLGKPAPSRDAESNPRAASKNEPAS